MSMGSKDIIIMPSFQVFNLPSYHLFSTYHHLFFLVSHVSSHSHLPPPWSHQPETEVVMDDQFICLIIYHVNRVQLPLILPPPPPPSHERDHDMVDGERGGGGGICSLTCGNETKQVLQSYHLPSTIYHLIIYHVMMR